MSAFLNIMKMKEVNVIFCLLISLKVCSSWDFFTEELSNKVISETVNSTNSLLCACHCVHQTVSCYGYVYTEETGLCQLLSACDDMGTEPRLIWKYSSHKSVMSGEHTCVLL